jgi:hypothetical protein
VGSSPEDEGQEGEEGFSSVVDLKGHGLLRVSSSELQWRRERSTTFNLGEGFSVSPGLARQKNDGMHWGRVWEIVVEEQCVSAFLLFWKNSVCVCVCVCMFSRGVFCCFCLLCESLKKKIRELHKLWLLACVVGIMMPSWWRLLGHGMWVFIVGWLTYWWTDGLRRRRRRKRIGFWWWREREKGGKIWGALCGLISVWRSGGSWSLIK